MIVTPFPLRRRAILAIIKVTVVLLLVVIMWRQISGLRLDVLPDLLHQASYLLPIIFLPVVMMTIAESAGWSLCIAGAGRGRHIATLFAIRVATDALLNAIPGGVIAAESTRPYLLRRYLGLDWTQSIAGTLSAKVNIAITQMAFIALGLSIMFFHPDLVKGLEGFFSWELRAIALALIMLASAGAIRMLYSGRGLTSLLEMMRRVPWVRQRSISTRLLSDLGAIDTCISGFLRSGIRRVSATFGLFFVAWVLIASETVLILVLLGGAISLEQAIVMEGMASLIRISFFFLPSGIGAQEVGIIGMFALFGIPEAAVMAPAYMILRRAREIVWAMLGFGALAIMGVRNIRTAGAEV